MTKQTLLEENPRSGVVLSDDEIYRYKLWRRWGTGPTIAFIMLNPSTADAQTDDPTIKRCKTFARKWGYGSLEIYNLYAFRTPYPGEMLQATDPVGPKNDLFLTSILAHKVVAAWGVHGGKREREVTQLVTVPLYCLGKTSERHPKHPLYIKGNTELEAWP